MNPADATDTADAADANAFHELTQGDRLATTTNTGKIAVDEPSDIPDTLPEQTIEFESHFLDTSTVVVDQFPFGNPGAPIPGTTQGSSWYDMFRARHGESIWAPFKSQRDWDIACWAKMHSTTSTAVDDYLAIPGVCPVRSLPSYVANSKFLG